MGHSFCYGLYVCCLTRRRREFTLIKVQIIEVSISLPYLEAVRIHTSHPQITTHQSSTVYPMADLFNNHPVVSHSLREFADRAYAFYEHDETDDNFIRFVLTGEYIDDDGHAKQAFVDPIQNAIEPDHSLLISRDYDSLLGIADKLMVNCPISVYVVPHDTFALKTSIHLKHAITYQGVSFWSPTYS